MRDRSGGRERLERQGVELHMPRAALARRDRELDEAELAGLRIGRRATERAPRECDPASRDALFHPITRPFVRPLVHPPDVVPAGIDELELQVVAGALALDLEGEAKVVARAGCDLGGCLSAQDDKACTGFEVVIDSQ